MMAFLPFLALTWSCYREETTPEPEFQIRDEAGEVALEYGQSLQYPIELEYFKYSAAASDEVLKAQVFTVASNCSWRLVPVGDDQAWVRPFPDSGEKEGRFIFLVERNNDQNKDREACFNVFLDDGVREIQVEGMLVVRQNAAVDFLKLSTAAENIVKEGEKRRKIRVTTNLDWNYKLSPDADFATENLDWLKDETVRESSFASGTLVFSYLPNLDGAIRGAVLEVEVPGKPEFNKTVKITQFGAEVSMEGFPVKWAVRIPDNTYAGTFPANGTAAPVEGAGILVFNHESGLAHDVDKKGKFDVSDNCPRVSAVWPGDYCEFKAFSPVSAGSIIKLSFTTRVSATGQKYWRLEYRDGEEWKIAGLPLTDENVQGPDGLPVVYTHAMNPDGKTNIEVNSAVKYKYTTDEVVFRFICAANEQAQGLGPLEKPNGGTWRLSVNSKDAADPGQPLISCVAAGTESMIPAKIEVSDIEGDLILFEGRPAGPVKFKVTSDMDFSVVSDVPWLTVENGEGEAFETREISVCCEESRLASMRKGKLTIKSGITKRTVTVVQSAAGGELQPLIGVVGGNKREIEGEAGRFAVKIQANVPYHVEIVDQPDWLNLVEQPETKGLVEMSELVFEAAKNSGAPRTAEIRLCNEKEKLVTSLWLTQKQYEWNIAKWRLSTEDMDSYKELFTTAAGEAAKAAGSGNAYLPANAAGEGRIEYWTIDKTQLDVNNKFSRVIGATGEPYITGAWPGDYWLITGKSGKEIPAGAQVNFSANFKASGTGMKYWMVEYSEGGQWLPALPVKHGEAGGESFEYSVELMNTGVEKLSVTYETKIPTREIAIRLRCQRNAQAKNSKPLGAPNGGTIRFQGEDSEEGCSPCLKVL